MAGFEIDLGGPDDDPDSNGGGAGHSDDARSWMVNLPHLRGQRSTGAEPTDTPASDRPDAPENRVDRRAEEIMRRRNRTPQQKQDDQKLDIESVKTLVSRWNERLHQLGDSRRIECQIQTIPWEMEEPYTVQKGQPGFDPSKHVNEYRYTNPETGIIEVRQAPRVLSRIGKTRQKVARIRLKGDEPEEGQWKELRISGNRFEMVMEGCNRHGHWRYGPKAAYLKTVEMYDPDDQDLVITGRIRTSFPEYREGNDYLADPPWNPTSEAIADKFIKNLLGQNEPEAWQIEQRVDELVGEQLSQRINRSRKAEFTAKVEERLQQVIEEAKESGEEVDQKDIPGLRAELRRALRWEYSEQVGIKVEEDLRDELWKQAEQELRARFKLRINHIRLSQNQNILDDPFARNVFFDRASKGGNPDVEPYRVANALFHVPEFDLIAKTSAPWNPIFDSFERHGREHSKVPLQLLIAPFFGAERSIFRGCKTAAWICPFFKQRFTIFDGVYGYNMRLDEWQVTDWHDKSIPYLIPEEEQVLHWMSQSPAAKMYRKAMQHYATLCRTSRPLAISSMRGSQMQAVSAVNANWGPMDILNFDIRTVPKGYWADGVSFVGNMQHIRKDLATAKRWFGRLRDVELGLKSGLIWSGVSGGALAGAATIGGIGEIAPQMGYLGIIVGVGCALATNPFIFDTTYWREWDIRMGFGHKPVSDSDLGTTRDLRLFVNAGVDMPAGFGNLLRANYGLKPEDPLSALDVQFQNTAPAGLYQEGWVERELMGNMMFEVEKLEGIPHPETGQTLSKAFKVDIDYIDASGKRVFLLLHTQQHEHFLGVVNGTLVYEDGTRAQGQVALTRIEGWRVLPYIQRVRETLMGYNRLVKDPWYQEGHNNQGAAG